MMMVQVEMKQVSERKKVAIILLFYFFHLCMLVGTFCCRQKLFSNA